MPDLDINGLPEATTANPADYIVKWDRTQTSGQRTQKMQAVKFAAYVATLVPAYQINSNINVTTLPTGSTATASLAGVNPLQTLSLGIPQGSTGAQGPSGPAGATGAAGANGTNGTNGTNGAVGATGPAGPGVAAGGTAGQYLRKSSGTDYATAWTTIPVSEVTGAASTAALAFPYVASLCL